MDGTVLSRGELDAPKVLLVRAAVAVSVATVQRHAAWPHWHHARPHLDIAVRFRLDLKTELTLYTFNIVQIGQHVYNAGMPQGQHIVLVCRRTWLAGTTCGFSSVMGKGSPSSAAKLPSGDSVPDVSTMLRTPRPASARMASAALKHQYDSTGASTPALPVPRAQHAQSGSAALCLMEGKRRQHAQKG